MSRFLVRFFPILLALFLGAAILLTRSPARGAEQIGVTCEALGVSTMAQDQKNLIVCLKDDKGALVWKSMTGAKAGGVPVGAIIAWPVVKNPPDMQNADGTLNWLDCNGQSVPQTVYPELYAIIGAKLPDLRGLFLRGFGSHISNHYNTVTHSSGALGEAQGDASRSFNLSNLNRAAPGKKTEEVYRAEAGTVYNVGPYSNAADAVLYRTVPQSNYSSLVPVNTPIENESRPVNMAVRYLIRART